MVEPVEPLAVVTVKLEPVPESVKPISLLSAVVIVLPPLYAFCKLSAALAQAITLFEESKQIVLPIAVVRLFNVKKELESKFIVTPLVPSGVKVLCP